MTAQMRALVATQGYAASARAMDAFRAAKALFSDSAVVTSAPNALLPVRSNAYVQFAIPAVAALLALNEIRDAQALLDVLTELMKTEGTSPLPALPREYITIADAHKFAAVYLLAGLCRQKSAADQARKFFALGLSCTDRTRWGRRRAGKRAGKGAGRGQEEEKGRRRTKAGKGQEEAGKRTGRGQEEGMKRAAKWAGKG